MKRLLASITLLTLVSLAPASAAAKADDFGAVVKVVEQFYGVKHKGLPFLAKAGIKTATGVARLSGGKRKRFAEAGSAKVAFFEGQQFNAKGSVTDFRANLKATLAGRWLPFVQVLSLNDGSQTYVFLRDAGTKYAVLVVTVEQHDAAVVQVNVAPQTLAELMQNPNDMGKAITDEATSTNDQE
jgi:hypothetical protein